MNTLIILSITAAIAALVTWDYMDVQLVKAKNRIQELEYQLNAYRQTCSGCGKDFYHACSEDCLTILKDEILEK